MHSTANRKFQIIQQNESSFCLLIFHEAQTALIMQYVKLSLLSVLQYNILPSGSVELSCSASHPGSEWMMSSGRATRSCDLNRNGL